MKKSILGMGIVALATLPLAASIGFASLNPIKANATGGGSGYAPYQVVNGGFETGNLTGWRTFSLWKTETGVVAFHDNGETNNSRELVTNSAYFNNFPYNRDGNYNIGVTYSGSTNWPQNDEHMGYLRSGDFTLGGSGWISFKLGGGKNPDFAYVSFRKVSDDTEVARFGNRFWNNTTQATAEYGSSISNAEAFLFKYYFNLSTLTDIGTKLYITLAMTSGDNGGHSWSILSADSFVTYYETAPTVPDNNYLATNILPTIINASSPSTGSIPGGNFDNQSDFNTYWTNVDGTSHGWKWDSGDQRAKSNGTDDNDLNVLRSSAFKIEGTADGQKNCLRFDWNGGLKYDKQIFLSIKEVGTNIEKIRAVRRDDKSGYAGGDRDNAMVDLRNLGASKAYYLEFADNATSDVGSWAISIVDTVRLVTYTDFNGITSGDRCAIVSGIPTSFSFSKDHEAICWSQHFLDVTGTYCTDLHGGDMAGEGGAWEGLGTDYATLTGDAMGDFATIPSDTTQSPTNILLHNPPISPAVTRYQFLIGKYSALHNNNFMVNSGGSPIYSRVSNIPSGFIDSGLDPTALVVGSIAFAGLVFVIVFHFHKRSKRA